MREKAACLMVPQKWTPKKSLQSEAAVFTPHPIIWTDTLIFHISIVLREFISTMCLILMQSRLGSSLFIAAPLVTFYIGIVFRRPLNNPFVLTFACVSAGDWKNANVAGYPGFRKDSTRWYELFLFWFELIAAQILGAVCAAYIKASYAKSIGSEFISGAAWGINNVYLKVAENSTSSCWKGTTEPVPARLLGSSTGDYLTSECVGKIQGEWWFMEDFCAVLFLIVAYTHLWKWLRWDDEAQGNPPCDTQDYWAKLVYFSAVSAFLNMTTVLAFPTAHAGLHTTTYLSVYQYLRKDLSITVEALHEPIIRGFAGVAGCGLAVLYEWTLARFFNGKRDRLDILAFKILYHNNNISTK